MFALPTQTTQATGLSPLHTPLAEALPIDHLSEVKQRKSGVFLVVDGSWGGGGFALLMSSVRGRGRGREAEGGGAWERGVGIGVVGANLPPPHHAFHRKQRWPQPAPASSHQPSSLYWNERKEHERGGSGRACPLPGSLAGREGSGPLFGGPCASNNSQRSGAGYLRRPGRVELSQHSRRALKRWQCFHSQCDWPSTTEQPVVCLLCFLNCLAGGKCFF